MAIIDPVSRKECGVLFSLAARTHRRDSELIDKPYVTGERIGAFASARIVAVAGK